MISHQRKAEAYPAGDIESAGIIIADPERYPGLMQEWAAIVLNPHEEAR